MRNNISSTRVVLLASGLALSLSACAAYSPSSYGSSYGYVDQPAGFRQWLARRAAVTTGPRTGTIGSAGRER